MRAFFKQFFHCLIHFHQAQVIKVKNLGTIRSCYTCGKDFK